MTLEEAIKHCEEVAEENEKECKLWEGGVTEAFKQKEERLRECASEHRQLAEWLKKLQAYEEAEEKINRKMKSGQWSDAVVFGMGKALLIMRNHIREVNADEIHS